MHITRRYEIWCVGIGLGLALSCPALAQAATAPARPHPRHALATRDTPPVVTLLIALGAAAAGALVMHRRAMRVAQARMRAAAATQAEETRQRQAAQEALVASEARYRHLVETTSDFVWEVDAAGVYRYASPQIQGILGYPPAALLGKTPFDFMTETEAATLRPYFMGVAEARAPIPLLRNINRHADGREVILESSGTPILSPDGELIGYRGIDRDVTEREQALAGMRHLRDQMNSLLRAIPLPLFAKDTRNRYTFVNPAFETYFSRPSNSIIGRTAQECWPAPLAAYYELKDQELLATDGVQQYEHEVPTAGGPPRWALFTKACLHDEAGLVNGLVGTVTDLSLLKDAERQREHLHQELQSTAALLETVLNALPDIITVHDAEGRVLRLNRAGQERLRTTGAPTSPQPCFQVLGQVTNCPDCPVEESRRTHQGAHRVRFVKELEAWYDVRVYPVFRAQGELELLVEHLRDITGEKRAEADRQAMESKLQHTQKLQSLGILAGGIAHDFNNLLVGVMGNADLALMQLPPGSDLRPLLQDIETAAQRAAELCKQMLAYSGQGRFVIEPVNVHRAIEDMAAMLDATLSRKAVMTMTFAPDLPLIDADVSQFRQTIMNLITNASEALGGTEGRITLEATTEIVAGPDASPPDEEGLRAGLYVRITVSDTGCGMDKATVTRMFDPFFTTKFVGRGLGLAAVQGIVRAHHGAIRVDSAPGNGTRIQVLFPARPPRTATPLALTRPPPTTAPWRGSGTILLADDDAVVREVVTRLLGSLGFEVVQARDGQEAVELFTKAATPIRLVILDLSMPRMDGVEAMRAIRALDPKMLILISSGYSAEETASRLSAAESVGFLQKPYERNRLCEKLRQLMG